MKKIIVLLIMFFVYLPGCVTQSSKAETTVKSVPDVKTEKGYYWLDRETGTVHKVFFQNGTVNVVSVIKYKEGKIFEEMQLLSSRFTDRKLRWSYFVPSTEYAVEITSLSIDKNEISVEWKNRSNEGAEDSGRDLFSRCNENGTIYGKDFKITDEENLPAGF